MKELLLQYARYNVWANKLMIDAMVAAGEAMAMRETASSFPTLQETMLHVWSAESIWLQRLQQAERPIWHAGNFSGTFADGCREWEKASAALVEHLETQTNESLQTGISFNYRSGKEGHSKAGNILHHVFNHSTYHRGQFVTMLRQLGVTTIPGTDLDTLVALQE